MTEHIVTVAELSAVLVQLRPGDLLFPNRVANLSIVRDDEVIGYIDLLVCKPQVERLQLFNDETTTDETDHPQSLPEGNRGVSVHP